MTRILDELILIVVLVESDVVGYSRLMGADEAGRQCQSKIDYFAKTSEPDFAAIDFPPFFRVDLSGSMAAPSIWDFALTTL